MNRFTRRDTLALGGAAAVLSTAAKAAPAPLLAQSGITLRDGDAVLTGNAFPALVWRPAGEPDWRVIRATGFSDIATTDQTVFFSARFGEVVANLTIDTSGGRWAFGGTLTHTGDRPIELQRFDYLTGTPADPRLGLLAPQALLHRPNTAPSRRSPCPSGNGRHAPLPAPRAGCRPIYATVTRR